MIRYTVETTRALAARPDVDVHVHCNADSATFFVSTLGLPAANVHRTTAGSTIRRSIEEMRGLSGLVEELAPDVVFGSKQLLPTGRMDATRILAVHDMLPMDRPGDFGLLKRTLLPRQYRRSIAAADVLACVSVATRDRLISHVPEAAPRASVIRNATTSVLRTVDPVAVAAIADRPFALVVGDFSLRKNVRHVVHLWSAVRAAQPDAVLALAGPAGWGRNEHIPELDGLLAEGAAVLLGHVSDGELRWAYEHAVVLLCPSLLEGFGLPVVEAAAFGCPTIVSTDPALVEAAADAATVVDTSNPAGWVAAIDAAFSDPTRRRQTPSDRLRTWDDTAAELYAAAAAHTSLPAFER